MDIVMIGAGRLATQLTRTARRAGHRVLAVYSRTEASAQALAREAQCMGTCRLEDLPRTAHLYIVSVSDDAVASLLEALPDVGEALCVHTAGSLPLSVFPQNFGAHGVLYPMQTFSAGREVDFGEVSLFLEASSPEAMARLRHFAQTLSSRVYELSSADRRYLHLAAVFACNFTNHCYAQAERILRSCGLPFSVMLPLVDETARKVHHLAPSLAQTGPAVRGDVKILQSQADLLAGDDDLRRLYEHMSESIRAFSGVK